MFLLNGEESLGQRLFEGFTQLPGGTNWTNFDLLQGGQHGLRELIEMAVSFVSLRFHMATSEQISIGPVGCSIEIAAILMWVKKKKTRMEGCLKVQ